MSRSKSDSTGTKGGAPAGATVEDAVPEPRRIGVLSLHNSKETKAICNAIEALGHEPVWLREGNLRVHIEAGEPVVEPDVDLVVNRLLLSNAKTPLENLELAVTLANARPFVNRPGAVLTAIHKYATAVRLAAAGVPTPRSSLALDPRGTGEPAEGVSFPAVSKPAIGTHGDGARRVDGDDDRSSPRPDGHTVYQPFLDQTAEQSDVRVYVVDGGVTGAMRRTAPEDDWRANVARGGTVTDVTGRLPDRVRDLALRATRAVGLDVAGVDLMRHDGEWYVLEVNPTAGFRGLFEATGRSPAPHIARLAIERLGGDVEDDAIEPLAATFDDSVPDCKPEPSPPERDVLTVGATETVELAGRDGSERVLARVDTGADRTSIDVELAAEIGAGTITGSTTVRSPTRERSKTRPLVDVYVALADRWEPVTASLEDRGHMNYPIILGRDVLSGYRVDVDRRANDPDRSGRPAVGGDVDAE